MNALEFVNTPVQRFRPAQKHQKATKAKKDDDSTSMFGAISSTKSRKWVRQDNILLSNSCSSINQIHFGQSFWAGTHVVYEKRWVACSFIC